MSGVGQAREMELGPSVSVGLPFCCVSECVCECTRMCIWGPVNGAGGCEDEAGLALRPQLGAEASMNDRRKGREAQTPSQGSR